ncbi:MAG: hypothetical protein R2747_06045 [Pyrinomonadaceae bacterium]
MKLKKILPVSIVLLLVIVSSPAQKTSPPTNAVVPLVDLKLKGLLGGVKAGKWIKADEVAKGLSEPDEFLLINKTFVEEGGVTTGSLVSPEPPCDQYFGVDLELESDSGVAIGTGAKWNLFPRKPLKISSDNSIYLRVVQTFLKKNGLEKTVTKIKEIYKVDLDGDKQDEVVIAGTYYKNGLSPSAAAGDYSFVMVRKIVRKFTHDIILEGDFIKKDLEFGAPNEYDLSAIADLNGDGKMEIVVFGQYYEGSFSTVFEIEGDKAKRILETGCGV